MNKISYYYIAYSYVGEERFANQIQSRNTFENLKKIEPSFKGIFLGNRKSLFWNIKKEDDKYFINRNNYKTGIIERYFKIGIFRKILFPRLFAWRAGKILEKDKNPKHLFARIESIEEGIFYLKRLEKLNIKKIVFELHALNFDIPGYCYWKLEKNYYYKRYVKFFNLLKNSTQKAKLVTLTKILADTVINKFDYKKNIEVVPDAHNFSVSSPKKINFEKNKIEIIYTGLTFVNRGIDDLIKALIFLDERFFLRLVGGTDKERLNISQKNTLLIERGRLIIICPVPNKDVKEKLLNADIAVIPYPDNGQCNIASPLKVFDYMACGLPIVASDIKSLREILTDQKSALFFQPGNSEDLAEKIKYLSDNLTLAREMGKNAFEEAKKYTYVARTLKIMSLFND